MIRRFTPVIGACSAVLLVALMPVATQATGTLTLPFSSGGGSGASGSLTRLRGDPLRR
jgi:hypothetical protein